MGDARPRLFIGNKNYSSWSLRPWLCLRWANIDFEEVLISLRQEGYGRQSIAEVLDVAPNGRVPALNAGETRVWDSLAIAEWAAEQAPEARLWPTDPIQRVTARSITCEMHSGFSGVRNDLPMNIARRCRVPKWPEATQREIDRIIGMWEACLAAKREGPWLFGTRGVADAFYAPVVTRFRTYGVDLPAASSAYADTLLNDPDFLEWEGAGIDEAFDFIDSLYPDA